MILLDTGILIDALRSRDAFYSDQFKTTQAAICGVVAAEVLYGARDAGHYRQLEAALAQFPYVDFPEVLWSRLAGHLFQLRTNGVTVPFQDVVIATIAIANDVEIWTRDRHYQFIQQVLPALKLFAEPAP